MVIKFRRDFQVSSLILCMLLILEDLQWHIKSAACYDVQGIGFSSLVEQLAHANGALGKGLGLWHENVLLCFFLVG